MSIFIEFELVDSDDLPEDLPALMLRKYWAPHDPTPGDGELCIFAVESMEAAVQAAVMLFGTEEQMGCVHSFRQVHEGFFIHYFD